MKQMGGRDYQLWDEEDGFFYDVLRYPDGRFQKFRVRSLVGLIPLFAVERLEEDVDRAVPEFRDQPATGSSSNRPDLVGRRAVTRSSATARRAHVLTIVNQQQLARHAAAHLGPGRVPLALRHPQPLEVPRRAPVRLRRRARCATSRPRPTSKIKGGNSNWRGPIWFPTSFLLIESLAQARHGVRARRSRCTAPATGRHGDHASTRWPRSWPTA